MRLDWLKHAFAVNAAPAEPTAAQLEVVEHLCREIVRRQMTTPALLFLEMSRPMNYLGSQALHFLTPFLSVVAQGPAVTHLAEFLERRDACDRLRSRIEALEQARAKSDA